MVETPTVHWLGTGLSTGSGLRVLAKAAPVVVYGRTTAKADACLRRLGMAAEATTRPLSELAPAPGEVVVSMLPADQHPWVLELCLERGAHFACSSYCSPAMADARERARAAGLVILTEAGLDPGIDHLLAHDLVFRAVRALGPGPATAVFTSYCGGIPAEPTEFRYRFSWAPRGVLTALMTPARYVEGGIERTVARPWEATTGVDLAGEEFEVYPNRDSVPFVAQYGIPDEWTLGRFVRGTLRPEGWLQAWDGVFRQLAHPAEGALDALAADLAARYPTTSGDRDRVVLTVALTVEHSDGRSWSGSHLVDVTGTEEESAMARTVSLPLACGVLDIVAGDLAPGVLRAVNTPDQVGRWTDFLAQHGLVSKRSGDAAETG